MKVTRIYRFAASHRLHSPRLSDEENRRVYGKCDNPFGHGHDYVLEVTVAGPLDAAAGRVVEPERLDRLVETRVLQAFRHRDLNTEVDAFSNTGVVPTTENLALEIRRRLAGGWEEEIGPNAALERVRLYETRKNIVETREN